MTARFAFAGDRDLSVWVLDYLLNEANVRPEALLVPSQKRASHADELIALCSDFLPNDHIIRGTSFRKVEQQQFLNELEVDYVLGIHFPYIVPQSVLDIPKHGVLNLHPAYLPFNRGWHTPSWALLDGTPYGATLHFMNAGIDMGDIVHQKQIEVGPADTANTLYQRVKALEFEVFKEAWPTLADFSYSRTSQSADSGSSHVSDELYAPTVQAIDLDATVKSADLLRQLRALTTNRVEEAAYFETNGKRYSVQLTITESS